AALDPAAAVELGTLGPVVSGRDRLNGRRAEFVVQLTHDSGVKEAEIYVHLMLRRMTTADILEVLDTLRTDARLAATIDGMPQVQALLETRGIMPSGWIDRPARGSDFWRSAGESLAQGAYAHNRPTSMSLSMRDRLPPDYQAALDDVIAQEFAEHF